MAECKKFEYMGAYIATPSAFAVFTLGAKALGGYSWWAAFAIGLAGGLVFLIASMIAEAAYVSDQETQERDGLYWGLLFGLGFGLFLMGSGVAYAFKGLWKCDKEIEKFSEKYAELWKEKANNMTPSTTTQVNVPVNPDAPPLLSQSQAQGGLSFVRHAGMRMRGGMDAMPPMLHPPLVRQDAIEPRRPQRRRSRSRSPPKSKKKGKKSKKN